MKVLELFMAGKWNTLVRSKLIGGLREDACWRQTYVQKRGERAGLANIKPLTPRGTLMSPFTEILILFLEGIIKKISYERRAYESVDEKSLS